MANVNGVHYPVGSDTYDLPADWILHAQTDAQQALDAAAAAVDGLDIPEAGLPYQTMPTSANWRNIDDGIYRITTFPHAESLFPGLPAGMMGAGVMRVMTARTGGARTYEFISAADKGIWYNVQQESGDLVGWQRITIGGLDYKVMPNGANWQNIDPGIYRITTTPHAESLFPGLPAAMLIAGIMRVTYPSTDYRVYEWLGKDGATWRNAREPSGLTGWARVTTTADLLALAPRTHTDPIRIKPIPAESDWADLADGVWTVTTFATASGLTPELPFEMRSAFVLRITSMNATTRNYEFQSASGKWYTSRTPGDGLLPWTRAASETEVSGYATQEDLGRFVVEGDERLWNRRPPLDTDWTEVTPGLELRRVGQQVYARAASLTTTGGIVLATIPDSMTPAGSTDVSFTGTPGYVDATGLHLDSTDPASITGVVSWLTDAEWDYSTEGKRLP